MSPGNPIMRDFAERLVAYETRGKKAAAAKIPAAFEVCEKLRPQLATLMGQAGFSALLGRALALAGAELPWLRTVRVAPDGSLTGWAAAKTPAEAEQLAGESIAVLTQLLSLLAAFIGENLTLRLLRDVWPKLSLSDLYFDKGD